MKITLPYPPSVLNPNKSSREHWGTISKKKKQYRKDCFNEAKVQGVKRIKTERLYVHLAFYPLSRIQPDDDNAGSSFKAGRDGLADALGIDDKVMKVMVDVMPFDGNPRVEVIYSEDLSIFGLTHKT